MKLSGLLLLAVLSPDLPPTQIHVKVLLEQTLIKVVETGKCYVYFNDFVKPPQFHEVDCP